MRVLQPAALLACALALGSGRVSAQQETPPRPAEEPVFGETLEVRVVNVEVVVTDKSGNRVTGLKPGDFRIKVDGKEVPVGYFSEILGGQSVATPAVAGETSPEAVTLPGMAPGGAVGTSYMVFIDDYFPTQIRRNEVLQSLKNDLSKLGPEDRMAIVAYDGRLTLITSWQQSQAALAKAFDQAMARPTRGLDRVAEFLHLQSDTRFASTSLSDSTPRAPDGTGIPLDVNSGRANLSATESAYGTTLTRQVAGVVSAAARTLRAFASPPGRKVLLLLDGGWPYSIEEFVRANRVTPSSREFNDGEALFHNLTSTANLLGYTVYPVDVPGIGVVANDASGSTSFSSSSFRDREIKYTLEFVAKETGGTALRNSNRIAAFSRVVADTRSYYWLGFSPDWGHDDAKHKVVVSLAGKPGLDVRSRENFVDLSKKSNVTLLIESALLFGSLPGGTVLPMRVGTMKKTRKGTEIPITLGLPADVVTLVSAGKQYAAHAELRFAATDQNGNDSEIPMVPLDIKSDHPALPGSFIKFKTKVTLKGSANHLVATVYDPVSGKLATAETDLTLP